MTKQQITEPQATEFEPALAEAYEQAPTTADAIRERMSFFDMVIPTEEEMRAGREAAYAWTRDLADPTDIASRDETSAPQRMNLLSLPAWLAVAEAADIPFIPARPLAEICAERFRVSLDFHSGDRAYPDFLKAIVDGLAKGEMVRMEQVAPHHIKSTLAYGEEMTSGVEEFDGDLIIDLYEDRFLTTFLDLGADRVRAFARPIVQPMMIEGEFEGRTGRWPAEFRVFVENGEVVGISNYYPQVDMDASAFALQIETALAYAQRMLDAMDARRIGVGNHSLAPDMHPQPGQTAGFTPKAWVPAHWDRQDWTLDFMVLEDGSVTFLEGGPAGMRAAHPCCFLQEGRDMSPDFLHGVAVSLTAPILPLADFAAAA